MASYDLPPWLQGTPDEPAKIFLQAVNVGSNMSQGAVANINRARAINEQARQFDAEQQRMAQFDEIRQGIQRYQLEEAGLQVQKMKLAKDYEFQTSKAQIELGNIINTTDPLSPEYLQKVGGVLSRYPAAWNSDVGKHALELPKQASQIRLQTAQAYHAMNPAPANAADAAAVALHVREKEHEDILQGKPPWTELQKVAYANKLREDKEFGKGIQGSLGWDDQGRPIMAFGQGAPTVATSSFAQKNLNTAEKNMLLLNDLSANLRGRDLGILGNLGEIVDRWAPQFGLPGFDKERASNREVLKVAVQGMVRQISSDTRFNENDRKRAEAAMVRSGWDENEQNARAVLDELRDIVRNRSKVDAANAGMPTPEWSLSPNDIIDAVQSGKMTKEKAIELRLKYYSDKYGSPSAR